MAALAQLAAAEPLSRKPSAGGLYRLDMRRQPPPAGWFKVSPVYPLEQLSRLAEQLPRCDPGLCVDPDRQLLGAEIIGHQLGA